MAELGCASYEHVVSPASHRCPAPVVALARGLIGAAPAPAQIPGQQPFVHALNECRLWSWLIDELAELARRDPTASVALICRVPATARRLQAALRQRNLGRLVLDGEFLFRSGVNVTELDQVKGLEFDYVIVPGAFILDLSGDARGPLGAVRGRHAHAPSALARRRRGADGAALVVARRGTLKRAA
jgi:superfamily I DNA/RNA helicase